MCPPSGVQAGIEQDWTLQHPCIGTEHGAELHGAGAVSTELSCSLPLSQGRALALCREKLARNL